MISDIAVDMIRFMITKALTYWNFKKDIKKKKTEKNTAQKFRQTAHPKKTPPRNFHRLSLKKFWVSRPGQTDSILAVSCNRHSLNIVFLVVFFCFVFFHLVFLFCFIFSLIFCFVFIFSLFFDFVFYFVFIFFFS